MLRRVSHEFYLFPITMFIDLLSIKAFLGSKVHNLVSPLICEEWIITSKGEGEIFLICKFLSLTSGKLKQNFSPIKKFTANFFCICASLKKIFGKKHFFKTLLHLRCCGTVVEQAARNQEIVRSNPARCWAFIVL